MAGTKNKSYKNSDDPETVANFQPSWSFVEQMTKINSTEIFSDVISSLL